MLLYIRAQFLVIISLFSRFMPKIILFLLFERSNVAARFYMEQENDLIYKK